MKINPSKTVNELVSALSYVADIERGKNIYHAWRVAILSTRFAKNRVGSQALKYIFYASLLHDIGGIGFPYHIIHYLKRNDKMSRHVLLSHPIIGAQLVSNIPEMSEVAKLILDHHEWVNGRGYPRQKTKNNIPFGSQVIRLADSLDIALQTGRYHNLKKLEDKLSLQFSATNIFLPINNAVPVIFYFVGSIFRIRTYEVVESAGISFDITCLLSHSSNYPFPVFGFWCRQVRDA